MPKFEYDEAIPGIQKCNLCWDRFKKGALPGCVEVCLTQALMFGTRKEILAEGKRRIASNPNTYVNHIYGEYEVGGTSHMYLSPVAFDKIGFRKAVGAKPYPEYTSGYLRAVPYVAALTPLFLLAVNAALKKGIEKSEPKTEEKHSGTGKH